MLKHKLILALLLATSVAGNSFAKKTYYTKTLVFPEGATIEQKADLASRLRPSDKQMAWQQRELTAFLHFGVNTFTNREWGDGTEDPNVFNPTNLNTRQWVKTLHDAGFKQVILTAKHHDGFCLWQTKTTKHSVASSAWRNGTGDVLADLRAACDEYGMKLGVYLSPWDRNASCYGSDAYNDMFVAQLTELLTNYGTIDEVWFDGACGEGPNGKKQVYDWSRYREVITRLQPNAVIAIQGDDVRWVGNENGLGRETEWSATALMPAIYPGSTEANAALSLTQLSPDLGSRDLLAKANTLYWWPSEVDVSIRPGWFWHATEQPKKLSDLAGIYVNSVGRNSVLLLNVPPTTDGLIAPADSARLIELHRWVQNSFADNRVAKLANSNRRASLRSGSTVNCVVLGERVANGQRVESFEVLARSGKAYTRIARGTTIGAKRILTFAPVAADELLLRITSQRGTAEIALFEAYSITLPQDIADSDIAAVRYLPTDSWTCLSHADGANAYNGTGFSGSGAYILDLGSAQTINGFCYTPPTDNRGTVTAYKFYTSTNGTDWTEANVPGEFGNILNNPQPQHVALAPTTCRYIKFLPLAPAYTIASLRLY